MSESTGGVATPTPLLEVVGASKSFPGVKALDKVRLDLRHGEVLALVGENGAGKSTLMKLLSGIYTPDEGEFFLNGERLELSGPKQAQELGISIIHQEFNLMPDLTIAQNIFIGREPRNGGVFLSERRTQRAGTGAVRPARARDGPDRARRRPHRGAAADGRDREGAQLRLASAHHG